MKKESLVTSISDDLLRGYLFGEDNASYHNKFMPTFQWVNIIKVYFMLVKQDNQFSCLCQVDFFHVVIGKHRFILQCGSVISPGASEPSYPASRGGRKSGEGIHAS